MYSRGDLVDILEDPLGEKRERFLHHRQLDEPRSSQKASKVRASSMPLVVRVAPLDYLGHEVLEELPGITLAEVAGVEAEELDVLGAEGSEDAGVKDAQQDAEDLIPVMSCPLAQVLVEETKHQSHHCVQLLHRLHILAPLRGAGVVDVDVEQSFCAVRVMPNGDCFRVNLDVQPNQPIDHVVEDPVLELRQVLGHVEHVSEEADKLAEILPMVRKRVDQQVKVAHNPRGKSLEHPTNYRVHVFGLLDVSSIARRMFGFLARAIDGAACVVARGVQVEQGELLDKLEQDQRQQVRVGRH
mmetsp:Transcript_26913/g.88018  ORF Transcript_26913/g.88018 Transcript_26913/m.88018 type:complete len:299 (+) Transcript_26913:802-1698(+)